MLRFYKRVCFSAMRNTRALQDTVRVLGVMQPSACDNGRRGSANATTLANVSVLQRTRGAKMALIQRVNSESVLVRSL